MKILAQAIPGNTFNGFRRAAEAIEHTWIWWEEKHTPTFDVFDEVKPDVMFLMETQPTRALQKCLKEYATPVVTGYVDKPFTFTTRDKEFACEYLVDSHLFSEGDPHPAYVCEFGIVCSPCKLGLQLCENLGHINVKIMCEQPWPVVQYLGVGSLENKRDLYRSSHLVLIDSILEAMRVTACGSIPVSIVPELPSTELAERCLHTTDVDELIRFHTTPTYTHSPKRNMQSLLPGHSYSDALDIILKEIE